MNKRDYGFKEQDMLTNFEEALKKTKAEAGPSFEKAIPSAIDHTVSLLKTDNLPTFDDLENIRAGVTNQHDLQNMTDNNYDQGQSQGESNTKEKVRVRSIGGLSPYNSQSSSTGSDTFNDNYPNMNGGYQNEDQNIWRAGGYTETMILIGTGVLVLLVFMVSYLMLNYFG